MKREATLKNSFLGRRAVVIGAGLGGLSTARVLADYFDEVIILDRDALPDDAAPRPGVPQGKHPGFDRNAAATKLKISPWQAPSIQEQAIRTADLCGLNAKNIKPFSIRDQRRKSHLGNTTSW